MAVRKFSRKEIKQAEHEHATARATIDLCDALDEIASKHRLSGVDMLKLTSEVTNRCIQRLADTTKFKKRRA